MIKISRDGKVLGDFDAKTVSSGLNSGKFLYTDFYWQDGSTAWMPLSLYTPLVKGKKKTVKKSLIKPTEEQEDICEVLPKKGEIMIINAYAGSGKTETLRLISERNPNVKFTYLCYNKDTAEKAKKRFPENVKCRTIHSLAYAAVGRNYKCDYRMPSSREVMQKFGITLPYVAVLALEAIERYFNSGEDKIEAVHFEDERDHLKSVLFKYPQLIEIARSIWSEMSNPDNSFPISHDGYLKLWSLNSPHIPGDVILHDESQDMNPVTLKILLGQREKTNPGLVIVGDSHQAIYGWRGAVNSMESLKLKATYIRNLTTSFRFGQEIADNASKVLQNLKKDTVRVIGSGPTKGEIPNLAYIGRKNASLIGMAISRMSKDSDLKFHFAGTRLESNWDPYYLYEFQKPLDLLNIQKGRMDLVILEQMKKFNNFNEVAALIKGDDEGDGVDRELVWFMKNLVDPYGDELPDLIKELRQKSVSPDEADLSVSTAHRSKGLEWENVIMLDDFLDLNEIDVSMTLGQEAIEEVNAIYVAMTRAAQKIEYGATLNDWINNAELIKS
jgi:hypothetical protein